MSSETNFYIVHLNAAQVSSDQKLLPSDNYLMSHSQCTGTVGTLKNCTLVLERLQVTGNISENGEYG